MSNLRSDDREVSFEVYFDDSSKCWWWYQQYRFSTGQPYGPFLKREEAIDHAVRWTTKQLQ